MTPCEPRKTIQRTGVMAPVTTEEEYRRSFFCLGPTDLLFVLQQFHGIDLKANFHLEHVETSICAQWLYLFTMKINNTFLEIPLLHNGMAWMFNKAYGDLNVRILVEERIDSI